MSFLCLEVASRTSCYITFPGTEGEAVVPFCLLALVVGMTFAFLQSLDTFPSHPDWSGITQRGSAVTPGSPLPLVGPALLPSSSSFPGQSLHHFITSPRQEFVQTLEAFKCTALLQISVGFEGVHRFFSRHSSETALQLLLEPELDFSIEVPPSNT